MCEPNMSHFDTWPTCIIMYRKMVAYYYSKSFVYIIFLYDVLLKIIYDIVTISKWS